MKKITILGTLIIAVTLMSVSSANIETCLTNKKIVRSNEPVEELKNNNLFVNFETIETGFNSPVVLTNAGDGSNRLFIADQIGIIYVIEDGFLLPDPYLDISDKIVSLDPTYDERGLLGLAFHPDYESNGRFFVYYSAPKSSEGINHESILSEYHVLIDNINVANPFSEKIIFRLDQPEANHNGGQLAFGPDGYLYLGLGDGGGAGDEHGEIGNGQNIETFLGSILRIDVNGIDSYSIPQDNPFVDKDGMDEIYAYGFRNPWKFSFDSETDELFVADVGQDEWEEIDIVKKGENYGWRIMEGTHMYDPDLADELGIDIESLQLPIHDYSHSIGKTVIGGYVYRADKNSMLYGKYIFGDWSSSFIKSDGKIYYLSEDEPNNWVRYKFNLNEPFERFILGFGQDENGQIYVLSKTSLGPTGKTGDVKKLVFNQPPYPPNIMGETNGKINQQYEYTFSAIDPEDENIYIQIDWGDGNSEEWIGPHESQGKK